jgi:hypothetical protein
MSARRLASRAASKTDAVLPAAFDAAANLILDTVEEAFSIVATNGRGAAYDAIVSVLAHYTMPKTPARTTARSGRKSGEAKAMMDEALGCDVAAGKGKR